MFRSMSKITILAVILMLAGAVPVAAGDVVQPKDIVASVRFAHRWVKDDGECGWWKRCTLVSSYKATKSTGYDVQGRLEFFTFRAVPLLMKKPWTLRTQLKHLEKGVRENMKVVDYGPADEHRVKAGIATWTKTINGQQVGFMKLRMVPRDMPGGKPVQFTTVLVRRDEAIYAIDLYIYDPAHKSEMMKDQQALLARLVR